MTEANDGEPRAEGADRAGSGNARPTKRRRRRASASSRTTTRGLGLRRALRRRPHRGGHAAHGRPASSPACSPPRRARSAPPNSRNGSGSARPPSPARSATSPRCTWSAASANRAPGASSTACTRTSGTRRCSTATRSSAAGWRRCARASRAWARTPRAGGRIRDTYDFLEFMQQELSGMLGRWCAHRASRDAQGSSRDG